jgi:hypothetical protein
LRNPCVDWGKACEFSVDFNNEVDKDGKFLADLNGY